MNIENKEDFIKIGRELAELHLNYESSPPCNQVNVVYSSDKPNYLVNKMKHPKIKDEHGKKSMIHQELFIMLI